MSDQEQMNALFSLAQDATRFAPLENQLLRAATASESPGVGSSRVKVSYKSNSIESAFLQEKKQYSYGL